MRVFKLGDWVIYHKPKVSNHPGPRAEDVDPAPLGELYSYRVDKFWVVSRVVDEKTIEVKTRTGKIHRIAVEDPRLARPSWVVRLRHRARFLQAQASCQSQVER